MRERWERETDRQMDRLYLVQTNEQNMAEKIGDDKWLPEKTHFFKK